MLDDIGWAMDMHLDTEMRPLSPLQSFSLESLDRSQMWWEITTISCSEKLQLIHQFAGLCTMKLLNDGRSASHGDIRSSAGHHASVPVLWLSSQRRSAAPTGQ
jgi:hypothetical protein